MHDDHFLRRIRWRNVARAAALPLLAALVVAWPHLRSPDVALPAAEPVPAVLDATVPAPPAEPVAKPPGDVVAARHATHDWRAERRHPRRPRRARHAPSTHRHRATTARRRPAHRTAPAPRAPANHAPPMSGPPPGRARVRPLHVLPATTEFAPARREFGP